MRLMTREEWYNSPDFYKLRFLNNIAAGIQHKTQEIGDALNIILAEHPEWFVSDKFSMVEMQARIVALEASKLWERCRSLATFLEPHQYSDVCKRCNNKWQEDGKCPTCQATKPQVEETNAK